MANCWECQFCDKESVLIDGKWKLTRTGYCLAEYSAVNGDGKFYQKVYANTRVSCTQYEKKSNEKTTINT
jgi:hypothetical protein